MKDWLLCVWFLFDVAWTVFLFGGAAYVVFALNRSPWWFLLAVILGPCLGGAGLYQALNVRFGVKEAPQDSD